MPRKKITKILAVIDYETDPFKYGRIPKPFTAGFYSENGFIEFWGDDCVKQLIDYLTDLKEPHIIYAHNGGKFDFFFMLEYLDNPLKIINGRIAKCSIGIHEVRDSYSILPFALATYKKEKIDYETFEKEHRKKHRVAITEYLKSDCVYLYELVFKFRERFGNKLTIGSTAISELKKYCPFDQQNSGHDAYFRNFYFGGRVEYFESGIIKGNFKIYDVNSMYPFVMATMEHPTGNKYNRYSNPKLDKKGVFKGASFYFAKIECSQRGVFPTRIKGEALNYGRPDGEFLVTSHELQSAIRNHQVSNLKVIEIIVPYMTTNFDDFVQVFMREKIAAKKSGDKVSEIFSKLILNSAYGKFATNPENYKDFLIEREEDDSPSEEWKIFKLHESGIKIWDKPATSKLFFDVATAASITGAARAVLNDALCAAQRPIYCDTDSIICESLPLAVSETALGAWKLEGEGDCVAIAGKKLYAVRKNGKMVKSASKGAILSDTEIFKIAKGGSHHWQNMAPSFSLKKGVRFVDRNIQSVLLKK